MIGSQPPDAKDDSFRDPFAGPAREQSFADPFAGAQAAAPAKRRFEGHIPGEVGIWVFIFGDMLVFGFFFGVFMFERHEAPEVFEEGRRTLDMAFGAVNTLLLLSGSLFVALALRALRQQRGQLGRRLLALAMCTGGGFIFNKVLEYTSKIDKGQTPAESDFYMYFFVFTGIHLFHLLVGMLALTILYRIARKPRLDDKDIRNIEAGGAYWHLVDLLWIILFALLYLVR